VPFKKKLRSGVYGQPYRKTHKPCIPNKQSIGTAAKHTKSSVTQQVLLGIFVKGFAIMTTDICVAY
jgi:hypothetical protein